MRNKLNMKKSPFYNNETLEAVYMNKIIKWVLSVIFIVLLGVAIACIAANPVYANPANENPVNENTDCDNTDCDNADIENIDSENTDIENVDNEKIDNKNIDNEKFDITDSGNINFDNANAGYESISKSINADISVGGNIIQHSQNEIYYVNKNVTIIIPDNPLTIEEEQEIIDRVKGDVLNEYPEEIINYIFEDKVREATYNGSEFSEFAEMESRNYVASIGSGEYEKQTIKFELTRYYKFYLGEDETNVVKMVDIISQTPVYQIIFDKIKPTISIGNEDSNLGVVDDGSIETVNIADESGIKTIEVYAKNKLIDTVDIEDGRRVSKYEYDILLSQDYGDKCTINIKAIDIAGNESSFSFSYEIDNTKPSVNVNGVGNGGIYKDNAILSINAKDDRGKVFLYYRCLFTDMNGNEKCIEEENSEYKGEAHLERCYSEEGIYDVSIYAYDRNGNYSDVLTYCFAVDHSAPTVSFENIENGKIYKESVTAYAIVKEPFFENMNVNINMEQIDKNGKSTLQKLNFETGTRLNKNIYTFDASGKYRLDITALDATGHSASAESYFTIDSKAPDIEILYQTNNEKLQDANNEVYSKALDNILTGKTLIFNNSPCLTVRMSDDFSQYVGLVTLYKKNDNNEEVSVFEKKIEGGSANKVDANKSGDGQNALGSDNKDKITIPINSEGKYVLKVIASDAAGNSSAKNVEFTVDETPPAIGYIKDFNEKYLTKFYLPDTLSDFIDDLTEVSYSTYLNSKEVGSLDINKDGKYILEILATDEADNTSKEMIAFIVDGTAPKIIVNGIDSNGKVWDDGIIKLSLFDEDDYFTKVYVNGKIQKLSDGGKTVIIDAKTVNTDIKSVNKDLRSGQTNSIAENTNAKYELVNDKGKKELTISVEAIDFAGNKINKEIVASYGYIEKPSIRVNSLVNDTISETLTKNETEIRETFFDKITGIKFVIFCGFIFATAVIFLVFAFVDMAKNKG